jgi:Flp pilus assembly protein TadD
MFQAFRRPTSDLQPRRAAIIAAVCVVPAAALAALPFRINDGRYDERLMLAKVLLNRHDYGGAAIELQQAHDLQPANTVTEFNLGIALVSAGRESEGIAHLRHAVDANVPIPGARYALANAMLTTGDRDGAVTLLRTFYPADNETAESCFQVGVMALNAGAPRVAERYLQRALQLRPGWPEALQALQELNRGSR